MPPQYRLEDVEAKYDVVLRYPNLELHSAAASGNVGLVHYALTHGQPVNSVLHGVLPLHAACSGGSVSVVRMLIERGADVNAPRLPRRYSDGKKSNAPSVGAAGSTPLHFAAANGHAPIAQILLTCGATPDKEDKNGMTPETLAEMNGHTDVIRVLRVWEHLQRQESQGKLSSLGAGGSEAGEPTSPATSTSGPIADKDHSASFGSYGSLHSRKGKERERAFSFSSNVSDTNSFGAIKVKHSFDKLFRGRSNRTPSFSSMPRPEISSPTSPTLNGLRITTKEEDAANSSPSQGNDGDLPSSPLYGSPDSPSHLLREESNLSRDTSAMTSGPSQSSLGLGQIFPEPPDRDNGSSSNLASSPSQTSGLGDSPSRANSRTYGSSRRPSLPSILEKAAHPGQAIKSAFRRDSHDHGADPNSSPMSNRTDPARSPGFLRGRRPSDQNISPHGYRMGRRHVTSKYMSKHALLNLFRRNRSPPSRSPSPPKRAENARPFSSADMDEGIAKLRRASMDLHYGRSSADDLSGYADNAPNSAPVYKTSFFPDELSLPTFSSLSVDPALIPLPPSPTNSTTSLSEMSESRRTPAPVVIPDRPTRSRKGSEVIVPSPLGRDWAHSDDSDSPSAKIRRSKSEHVKSSSQTTITSPDKATSSQRSTSPISPASPYNQTQTKQRSATLPSGISSIVNRPRSASGSGGRVMGGVDLRKVASGIWRRRSSRRRRETESPVSPSKVERVSEEKDETLRGDEAAETETIKLKPAPAPGTSGDDTAKLSSETVRSEGHGADADGEDETENENDVFHDAEESSLFDYSDYLRFTEPLEMEPLGTSSERPETPVVMVESPADEEGGGVREILHSPDGSFHEGLADVLTPETEDDAQAKDTEEIGTQDAVEESPPGEDVETPDTEKAENTTRQTSEETERGETFRSAQASPAEPPKELPDEAALETKKSDESQREQSPANARRVTPPKSKFVEIIAPDDPPAQPAEKSHAGPSRVWRFGRYRNTSATTSPAPPAATSPTQVTTPPPTRANFTQPGINDRSPPSANKRLTRIMTASPSLSTSISSPTDSRNRGVSISSVSSSASGRAYSFVQSGSTPSTSLTPPSTMSLGALPGSGFPPVPEHEVVHPHSPRRKASTSAEAREIIKQAEDDILHLAKLPPSLDSTRSLAAQLAAYGESHAMEEEFAQSERKVYPRSEGASSDRASFLTADTEGASRVPSINSDIHRPASITSRHSYGTSLHSVDAPMSSVTSINNIYDRRAAAYRERMTALTSPVFPTSGSSSLRSQQQQRRHHSNPPRPGSALSNEWLNVGPSNRSITSDHDETDHHPNISSPLGATPSRSYLGPQARKSSMPVTGSMRQISGIHGKAGSLAPSVLRSTHTLSPQTSRISGAGSLPTSLSVVHPRYPGLTPPMQSLGTVGAVAARSPSMTSFPASISGQPGSGLASGGSSPYVSIFSNRFTGPHDGDDSDDEEEQVQQYTLIENDWRGGHVVDAENFDRKKKWGIKAPFSGNKQKSR